MVNPIGLQPVVFTPIQPIAPVSRATPDLEIVDRRQTGQPAPADPGVRALAQATVAAAARQDGLGPLMADLAQALDAPDLPAPVRAAAAGVLALQTPLDEGLTAPQVRQAVSQSGLFLEARLAAAPQTPPGPDLKAALLVLRQVLTTAAGPTAPPPAPASRGRETPPPPYRGASPRGQRAAAPSLPAGASAPAVAGRLMQQASAALAREELLQLASLPQAAPQDEAAKAQAPARWLLEVPFATPQGPAVAQLEISRDGRAPGASAAVLPAWSLRFSIDVEPLGPVHAAIRLQGEQASVVLWAERPDSAASLRGRMEELQAAMRPVAEHADIAVYPGAPPQARPQPGRLVDQAS